jgi:O-antigen/teichoic acid export membrane protein
MATDDNRRTIAIAPSVSGSIWILVAKASAQFAQLGIFLFAARILGPGEFGLYAFVSAIAVLTVVLAEGGWAEFIMKSGQEEDCFDEVATAAILSGTAFTVLGLLISMFAWRYSDEAWAALLLALFSCWLLPAAVTTVYDGTLVARGQLRAQAFIRMIAESVGVLAALIGFAMGWQAAALVIGRLLAQISFLAGAVFLVGRLPRLRLTALRSRELIAFALHIVANRLVVFLGSYSGTLAIGSFLGVAEAGYYRAAERFVAALAELMGEPARALGWIVFRRARDRQAEGEACAVTSTYTRFLTALLIIGAPLYLGLLQVADPAVYFVLGDQWRPSATIVSILCIRQLLLLPGYATEPLLSVMGHVSKRLPTTLVNVGASLSLTLMLAPMGLVPLAVGQCLGAAIAVILSVRLQIQFGSAAWGAVARNLMIAVVPPSLAMIAVVLFVGGLDGNPKEPLASTFVLQIAIGAVIYCSILLLLARATDLFRTRIPK